MTTPVLPVYKVYDEPGPNADFIPDRSYLVWWTNAYGSHVESRHFDVGGVKLELKFLHSFGIIGNVYPPLPPESVKRVKFEMKVRPFKTRY